MTKVYLLVQEGDVYTPIHALSDDTTKKKLFHTKEDAFKELHEKYRDYSEVFEIDLDQMLCLVVKG